MHREHIELLLVLLISVQLLFLATLLLLLLLLLLVVPLMLSSCFCISSASYYYYYYYLFPSLRKQGLHWYWTTIGATVFLPSDRPLLWSVEFVDFSGEVAFYIIVCAYIFV